MPKLKHLLISLIASASLFIIFSSSTHAATFTVADGSDENIDNSSCSLTEAITNINAQSTDEPDCVPTGAYGTDDTINLPAGTITLTAGLNPILESVVIAGEGMGQSVIDGFDGLYPGIAVGGSGTESVALIEMTIQNVDGTAVLVRDANLLIDQLEVYGSSDQVGSSVDSNHGIVYANTGGASLTVSISNTHIHDLVTADSSMSGISIDGDTTAGGSTEVELTNITINNLEALSANSNVGMVITSFDGVGHDMNITISNSTITNLSGPQSVAGVTAVAAAATADASMNVDAQNITVNNLTGSTSFSGGSAGLVVAGAEAGDSFSAITTANVSNLLLSENFEDGSSNNCDVLDLTSLLGGSGTPELSIISNGGNLSDDNTCSSYFTQPTDQNNLTNLASTLGTLGDYGGYVPTIPLLEGSPAVDAGVTVAGLTSDARGVSRPLGLAYDSGAYESPFTKTVEGTETLASTGQNIKLVSFFAALLLVLGLMLQLRRHNV